MEFRIPHRHGCLKRRMPAHAMGRRGPDRLSAKDGGAFGSSRFRGLASAALGGGREALGCDLRGLMRFVRHHLLVNAMMAGMPDMMAAHPGIGVERTFVRLCRFVHLSRLG